MAWLVLFCVLPVVGAIVSTHHTFLGALGPLPARGANLIVGGVAGGAVGGIGSALPSPLLRLAGQETGRLRGRARVAVSAKVFDSSAIVDGWIGDLLRTGFINLDL